MPVNDISLLPDNLRAKEAEAKARASEAKAPPSFRMHVPQNEVITSASTVAPQVKTDAVKFGNGTKPEEKKGVFQIFKRVEKPIVPVVPPVPAKPKLKPDMWLKYFDPGKGVFKKIKPNYLTSRTTTAEYNWVIQSEYWLKMRIILLVGLIILIVFSVGCLSIKSYHNGRLVQYNALVEDINQVNSELQNYTGYQDRASTVIGQAKIIQAVMVEHISWTKLFNVLERTTLADVSYTDFQIINESLVNLTVVAPNYSTIAQQVEVFEQTEGITMADVSDASVAIDKHTDDQEVTGLVQLTLAPDFWNK